MTNFARCGAHLGIERNDPQGGASRPKESAVPNTMDRDHDVERLTDAWILHSEAFEKAHAVEQYARYWPDIGFRAILAVLAHPQALDHVTSLSHALAMLISQYGDRFIERIEREAKGNFAFRSCLAEVQSSPVFPLPIHLWTRLSAAAGKSIGPISPGLAQLYEKIPNLSENATRDPNPPEKLAEAPAVSDADLVEHASAYILREESFWAWEEIDRILREGGPDAAWPLIVRLVEKGSDRVLGAVGAGLLEDLLDMYGGEVIERVELAARHSSRFRLCLTHVWRTTMAADVWDRVVVARGVPTLK